MSTFTAEVKDKKLLLPAEAFEWLGWRDSTKILIEKNNGTVVIRQQELTAEEIADIACVHLIEHVGDATAVKMPVWRNGKWHVEIVLSYRNETVGHLTFSSDGQLIESESDSPAKMKGVTL